MPVKLHTTPWALLTALLLLTAVGCDDSSSDLCAGATCSGHGECVTEFGRARCLCEPDYYELGLECLPRSSDGDADADADGGDRCRSDDDCRDDLFCNGAETCAPDEAAADAFGCLAGEPVDCDDGIAGTVDTCSEERGDCVHDCADLDEDGHADAACVDEHGDPLGDDCDDLDPDRFPGNPEVCDPGMRDEDCDLTTVGDTDADGDGFVAEECCNYDESAGMEGPECGTDCDDANAGVRPGVQEVCDFRDIDENCNGEVNEGLTVDCFPDLDDDGYAAAGAVMAPECEAEGRGHVGNCPPLTTDRTPVAPGVDIDCDDANAENHPGAAERCDGEDNDCDGLLADAVDLDETDRDGDGFLECDITYFLHDCDDDDARAFPGQTAFFETPARLGVGGYDFNCDGFEVPEDSDMGGCMPEMGWCAFYEGWFLPTALTCGELRPWVIDCVGANPFLGCVNSEGWGFEMRRPACQ